MATTRSRKQTMPDKTLTTFGRGRTIRLHDHDYAADHPVHLVLCAYEGRPFETESVARMTCDSLERTAEILGCLLYGYCLMPDHLHVLVSPGESQQRIAVYLRRMKSFTTREYQKITLKARLWQTTAYDRVMRKAEDPRELATYIANNPVRANLVECWMDWPYSRILVD